MRLYESPIWFLLLIVTLFVPSSAALGQSINDPDFFSTEAASNVDQMARLSNALMEASARYTYATLNDEPSGKVSNAAILSQCTAAQIRTWYVKATANSGGQGTESRPFNSLAEVEAASCPNDTIVILHMPAATPALDGGIRLKDGQRLLGSGPDVTNAPSKAARAKITNSSGDAVVLANDNEVAGLHVENAGWAGIVGPNVSGAYIHHNLITGFNKLEVPFLSRPSAGVEFYAFAPLPLNNSVHDNVIRDARDQGIRIFGFGQGNLRLTLDGNRISDLDTVPSVTRSEGMLVLGDQSGTVEVSVKSVRVGRIGSVGDGLLAVAWGSSFVNVDVDRYVFETSVGNNFHSNGAQTFTTPGARIHFRMQNSDLLGAAGFGFVAWNPAGKPGPGDELIDLGGGALGSVGNNRFENNGHYFGTTAQLLVENGDVVARHNWWGTAEGPQICPVLVAGATCLALKGSSTLDFEPFLTMDPRRRGSKNAVVPEAPAGDVSHAFAVRGSFPNPFNPSTSIQFDLPESARVHAEIFDISGRQVMTLPSRRVDAGINHRLFVNASSLSSGVYLYRLIAETSDDSYVASGKLHLVK